MPSRPVPVSTLRAKPPAPSVRSREHVPFGHLDQGVDDGLRVDLGENRPGAGQEAAENVDGGIRGHRAHAPRLGEIGDKERPAAGFGQGGRDFLDAAAVGVGVEHGGAFAGAAPRQRAPIHDDGGEIDFQNAADFGFQRALGGDEFRDAVVVDDEPAAAIDDLAVDRAFDDDLRAFLDGEATLEVATHVEVAIFLNDRVVVDRPVDVGRAADQQRLHDVLSCCQHHNQAGWPGPPSLLQTILALFQLSRKAALPRRAPKEKGFFCYPKITVPE